MNRITSVTKRKIRELFTCGIDMGLFELDYQIYPYYGSLNDVDFLNRLYPLSEMPVLYDTRYKNAEEEIIQHTRYNADYAIGWVFDDERFPLKNGSDEDFLDFILQVLSPDVRIDGYLFNKYVEEIRKLLEIDGYELYIGNYVSNQPYYVWNLLSEKEITSPYPIPFSIRLQDELKSKSVVVNSIPKRIRYDVYKIMTQYNTAVRVVSETGFETTSDSICETLQEIRKHYIPKAYNANNEYVETEDLENFITSSAPQCVYDAIEIFSKYIDNEKAYSAQINTKLSASTYKLIDRKFRLVAPLIQINNQAKEQTLKSLIEEAFTYANSKSGNDLQRGLEKIWDAFERIKSMCHSDKKESISILLDRVSKGDETIRQDINQDMEALSKFGNTYQIRHFEKNKKEVPSDDLKLFYFNRCASIINLCMPYIQEI